MSYREAYCPSCSESASRAGLKAPPGWYRCPACEVATMRHKLPQRTIHRTSPVLSGTFESYLLLFADFVTEVS